MLSATKLKELIIESLEIGDKVYALTVDCKAEVVEISDIRDGAAELCVSSGTYWALLSALNKAED